MDTNVIDGAILTSDVGVFKQLLCDYLLSHNDNYCNLRQIEVVSFRKQCSSRCGRILDMFCWIVSSLFIGERNWKIGKDLTNLRTMSAVLRQEVWKCRIPQNIPVSDFTYISVFSAFSNLRVHTQVHQLKQAILVIYPFVRN